MAYLSEKVGCEVTHLTVSNDGDSSGWTCESMFCGESSSADTCSGQGSKCPVVAKTKCIMKCAFVECKPMISSWEAVTQL